MKSQAENMANAMKKTNPMYLNCGTSKGNSGDSSDRDSIDQSICDVAAISKKGTECAYAMSKASAGGMSLCIAFANLECCYKDAFSSCDLSLQKKIAEAIHKHNQ